MIAPFLSPLIDKRFPRCTHFEPRVKLKAFAHLHSTFFIAPDISLASFDLKRSTKLCKQGKRGWYRRNEINASHSDNEGGVAGWIEVKADQIEVGFVGSQFIPVNIDSLEIRFVIKRQTERLGFYNMW